MDAEVGEVRWIGGKQRDLNTTHLSCSHVVAAVAVIVHVSFPTKEDLLFAAVVDVPKFVEEDLGRETGDGRHESRSSLIWGVRARHESRTCSSI